MLHARASVSQSTTGYGVGARAGASSVSSFLDCHARCGATLAVILGAIGAYESSRFCQYVGRDGKLLLTPTPTRDECSRIGARHGSERASGATVATAWTFVRVCSCTQALHMVGGGSGDGYTVENRVKKAFLAPDNCIL